jgi:hypothetical protein
MTVQITKTELGLETATREFEFMPTWKETSKRHAGGTPSMSSIGSMVWPFFAWPSSILAPHIYKMEENLFVSHFP